MSGLAMLSTVIVLGLLYRFPIRRWYRRWGATDAEMARVMSGDIEISKPTYETTLAMTVSARPEGAALFMCVLEPAAFIMTRKMLLGLKHRAEALRGGET